MAKGDRLYFDNFAQTAALLKKGAEYLVNYLENFDAQKITAMLDEMHEIEHSADRKKHEMSAALVKAFVTPVDREDLDLLSQKLDDVIDRIEEILQRFYIYNIETIRPDSIEFAEKIVVSCGLICSAVEELASFKKSKKLNGLIIDLNSVEEECDRLYLNAMRTLTTDSLPVLETVSWRKIYDCFESCADACEHVSECLGSLIMNNT